MESETFELKKEIIKEALIIKVVCKNNISVFINIVNP